MPGQRVVHVRRREDALALTITLTGLDLDVSVDPPVLRRTDQDARVLVEMPAQHVGEEVFALAPPATDEFHGQRPQAFLAGPSRLCFVPADDTDRIVYDLASLLDLAALTPVVPEAALGADQPDGPLELRSPEAYETAVELPWRLVLAPPADHSWTHAATPVERGGRTEVWHTRLGWRTQGPDGTWRVQEYRPARPVVRAVWSLDLVDPLSPPPRMLPSGHDRQQIVRATSMWGMGRGADGSPYVPRPFAVERLMLASGGGWLAGEATFDAPSATLPVSLESWTHRASLGRDSYVRVVKRGYLYPWGHRASLIEVSERRVHEAHGQPVAALAYQNFIAVRVPLRDYAGHRARLPEFDHGFPFLRIRLTTAVSPPLDPAVRLTTVHPTAQVFACTLGLTPYEFTARVTDLAGRELTLGLPAVFVESTVAGDAGSAGRLDDWWNARLAAHDPIARVRALGQRIALAPGSSGNTSLETHFLFVGARHAPDGGEPLADYLTADTPPYFPVLSTALVNLNAAQAVSSAPLGTPEIAFDPAYLRQGFEVPGAGPAAEAQRRRRDLCPAGRAARAPVRGGPERRARDAELLGRGPFPVGGAGRQPGRAGGRLGRPRHAVRSARRAAARRGGTRRRDRRRAGRRHRAQGTAGHPYAAAGRAGHQLHVGTAAPGRPARGVRA